MTTFRPFPSDIAQIIADYCAGLKLWDWIQPEAVYANPNIWKNPKAVEAGVLDLTKIDEYSWEAATNPALIEYIKAKPEVYWKLRSIYQNSAELDWLRDVIFKDKDDAYDHIDWEYISANPEPRAVHAVCNKPMNHWVTDDRIDVCAFLMNPGAATYIKKNMDRMQNLDGGDCWNYWVLGNPANVDNIRKEFKSSDWDTEKFRPMSGNTHPWAIEQLRLRWNEIDMDLFAANPGIFKPRVDCDELF